MGHPMLTSRQCPLKLLINIGHLCLSSGWHVNRGFLLHDWGQIHSFLSLQIYMPKISKTSKEKKSLFSFFFHFWRQNSEPRVRQTNALPPSSIKLRYLFIQIQVLILYPRLTQNLLCSPICLQSLKIIFLPQTCEHQDQS